MKENGFEPRTLADDLFFYVNGNDHETKSVKGVEIPFQLVEDIGANVAKNKCFMTSPDERTKENAGKESLEKKVSQSRSPTHSGTWADTFVWIPVNLL